MIEMSEVAAPHVEIGASQRRYFRNPRPVGFDDASAMNRQFKGRFRHIGRPFALR
jgi:hypothetical protein